MKVLVVALALGLASCGSAIVSEATAPVSDFRLRAKAQSHGPLSVRAVALGGIESRAALGVDLSEVDIQPVWIEIDNRSTDGYWLFPHGIDEDYLPPWAVARRAGEITNEGLVTLHARLDAAQTPFFIGPGQRANGFVYAADDEGLKAFSVELHGPRRTRVSFHFVSSVPGMATDFMTVGPEVLEAVAAEDLDDDALRAWLEDGAPDTTVAQDGAKGDPLNVALVGELEALRDALVSCGWDPVSPATPDAVTTMASAFVFGGVDRYAPVSDLYAFGRKQDLAFERARRSVSERNHMRLWLAPVRHEGRPVWLGQISRDIGVKLSGRVWPPTTHVIDPEVDEARFFLLQNLFAHGRVARLAFAGGAPVASPQIPARNAEDDPYFSDGLRAVFFLPDHGREPVDPVYLPWTPIGVVAARFAAVSTDGSRR